ncbi:methionine synthase reductase [Dermochelys coriacea]|uniref:methionine synthase reductase n=1 Tax=Dermochelys coriacea TaxID=27794 RepID=UPI001CA94973|nr:methionine synthase reductase [Dermochelys coriacea]
MCCEIKRRFLLLYATQKGQAKAIAEEICTQADAHGFEADIHCISESDKYNLATEKDPLVVVISTTGTGDPPDTACKFVKEIKNKTLLPDHFAHLRYGLLGLGDSEYMFFCNGGKVVDKRLQELGAQHFYETGLADDCVGLEIVVEPWIDGLWLALRREFTSWNIKEDMSNNLRAVSNGVSAMTVVPSMSGICSLDSEIQHLKLEDLEVKATDASSQKPAYVHSVASVQDTEASLDRSVPPLSQSTLNIPALPSEYIDVQFQDGTGQELSVSSLISDGTVFHVPVTKAVQLTREDAVKTALLLELDVSKTTFSYQPGDAFCVICPNNPREVQELLHILGLSERKECVVCLKIKQATKKKGAEFPPRSFDMKDTFPCGRSPITEEVPAFYGKPGTLPDSNPPLWAGYGAQSIYKGFVCGSHSDEMPGLYGIPISGRLPPERPISSGGQVIINENRKESTRTTIGPSGDAFQPGHNYINFPDTTAPIRNHVSLCTSVNPMQFVFGDKAIIVRPGNYDNQWVFLLFVSEHLPKLQARSYSASSSNLFQPGKLQFVFNVVEFPSSPSRLVSQKGVCTGWLAELVTPMLQPHKNSLRTKEEKLSAVKVSIFARPINTFHLPSDPSIPFMMVGPGTGVSPFIGFLQHRQKLQEEHTDWQFGETWLFFGCRHQDRDYLFRDELRSFVENGTLTHLKVCFSRDPPAAAEKKTTKYVQDNIRLCAKEVARVLLKERGCFYVCGDAKHMAKDVNDTLVDILSSDAGVDKLEAMKTLATLRQEKRYLQDVWA